MANKLFSFSNKIAFGSDICNQVLEGKRLYKGWKLKYNFYRFGFMIFIHESGKYIKVKDETLRICNKEISKKICWEKFIEIIEDEK